MPTNNQYLHEIAGVPYDPVKHSNNYLLSLIASGGGGGGGGKIHKQYNVTNYTEKRDFDASNATQDDVNNILATLIADMIAANIIEG